MPDINLFDLHGRGLEIGPGVNPFSAEALKLDKGFKFFDNALEIDVVGMATQLPFKNNTFDFIVARHVLEHTANPLLMLREMARILTLTGKMVITLPNKLATFDFFRKPTSFFHLYLDYISHRKDNDKSHAQEWIKKVLLNPDARKYRMYQSSEDDYKEYLKFLDDLTNNRNLDTHFHVFTPGSFKRVFTLAKIMGLLNLTLSQFYDPDPIDTQAFTAILRYSR
ncbi:MAG TPA: class I SAM-dependent methyltransferase [Anaerolineae bacterium]|nr:class I SAM-dependent methyltransferase [Anaerolineae bacterium]HQI86253.1 class I SAM-dependent methyltransferase [Anaerolineae bacterium]